MRSLLPLLLIAALALVGTVGAAMVDNMQNGPERTSTVGFGPGPYVYGPAGTYSWSEGYAELIVARGLDGIGNVAIFVPLETNEFSFVSGVTVVKDSAIRSVAGGGRVDMYALDGTFAGYVDLSAYQYSNPTYDKAYNSLRITLRRSNQHIYVYVNEQLMGDAGVYVKQPAYFIIKDCFADDIVVGPHAGGVVGAIPNTWFVAKDLGDSSMTGLYDGALNNIRNTFIVASYNIWGDPATAHISIDGDEQVQTIQPKYIPLKSGVTWYNDTPTYSGYVTFNLTTFMQNKTYGRHTIELVTSTGTVEEEFWYKAVSTAATSITFDREVYAPLDSIQINSTIGTAYWQPGMYSYYGALYDPTTNQFKGANWSIASQTQVHSTAVSTDLFPATGEYMALLYAVDSQGNQILLTSDTAYMYADKVVFSGTVWDAQQGTILSGATVSLTQGGTTATQTTGSDGRFEFLNLQKDVLTQLSAAKSGYVTSWSNTTPTEYKRYEIEIALSPGSPAHSGEAVFGTVRSYPLGNFVASPTVRILKDGALVNSTTATAKGWYIFDGLDASTTYTIAVQKDGYLDYSNAVTTGSGGSSLTQLDPWLTPYFDLTVHLVDAVTLQPITGLMAVSLSDGQSAQTSTGTTVFHNVAMGAASVAYVGSGYEGDETAVTLYDHDEEITIPVMPLSVVPTTDIPLTPTPTPALVGMIGTVYDGMTGQPIVGATVEVSAEQGGVTRTDETDGSGDYSFANIQNGVLTTVNATATGYTHTPFSFTPAGSAEYIVNLYMYRTDESENPTIEPADGRAGAGGTVVGGPYHELVESPTVTATNGTWSGPATLSPDHVWYFTDMEPGGAYTFTASADGFVTRSVQATMGDAGSFTVVPIVLDGVYDVTITVKDADTYALILQPVQLSLSNGQTGNTSTGSYTFTNLEYATYVVSATSEGYTGGGISFLAYGDHTEYIYLAQKPAGSDSTYEYAIPPKPVEILCRNIFGMPLAGVTVTAQGGETTLPDRDLLGAFFGWGDKYSSADLANASMTGTTSSDGGITFMMTDALKYNVTFTDPARGIDETVELMPHDTQYMFVLGSMSATPVAGMPNMTLWADGAEGASPTLRGYYSDPAGTTSALYFVVERINGTVRTEVSNQSLGAVQTASPSYAVNHTTGAMYSWGFRATTPDRGALQQWNGITLHSRLVELPIEESAYFWVSMCLVFLFAGLFSGNNIKYGFVAFPMFCGVLWYIGWLNIAGITLGIVMVLGVLMYLAKVQVA